MEMDLKLWGVKEIKCMGPFSFSNSLFPCFPFYTISQRNFQQTIISSPAEDFPR
jgi:hypothetical protein